MDHENILEVYLSESDPGRAITMHNELHGEKEIIKKEIEYHKDFILMCVFNLNDYIKLKRDKGFIFKHTQNILIDRKQLLKTAKNKLNKIINDLKIICQFIN